jgi:hypothetical protein
VEWEREGNEAERKIEREIGQQRKYLLTTTSQRRKGKYRKKYEPSPEKKGDKGKI